MRHHGVGSLRQVQQTVPILDRCQGLFHPQVFLHMCVVLLLKRPSRLLLLLFTSSNTDTSLEIDSVLH